MLATLTAGERALLGPRLERVALTQGQVLLWPGEPVAYVYFPAAGPDGALVSVVAVMAAGEAVDAGVVGAEGLVGLASLLGAGAAPTRAVCQVSGGAWRLRATHLVAAAEASPALRARLLRYVHCVLSQAMQLAGCNRAHLTPARCARWLLMVHDRLGRDGFDLTHEYLAQLLGTRRPSVTVVMGLLQRAGLVDYARGHIAVRDRAGLEATACPCYRTIRGEFDRLLPGSFAAGVAGCAGSAGPPTRGAPHPRSVPAPGAAGGAEGGTQPAKGAPPRPGRRGS